MLFIKMKGVHHPDRFVDVPSERQIIHHHVPDHRLAIDQECSSQGHRFVQENPVGSGNRFREIGHHRKADRTNATLSCRRLFPGQVRVGRIHTDPDDLDTFFFKRLQTMIERNNLGRTDKGEIEGPEKRIPVEPARYSCKENFSLIALSGITADAVKSGASCPIRGTNMEPPSLSVYRARDDSSSPSISENTPAHPHFPLLPLPKPGRDWKALPGTPVLSGRPVGHFGLRLPGQRLQKLNEIFFLRRRQMKGNNEGVLDKRRFSAAPVIKFDHILQGPE